MNDPNEDIAKRLEWRADEEAGDIGLKALLYEAAKEIRRMRRVVDMDAGETVPA